MQTSNDKLSFFLYRLSTIAKSLKALYTLSPEKVDAFLNSYEIYDHDWANEKELIEKMGKDYYAKVKQKLIDYYSVLNHLCALGQVEKMYIPPAMDLSQSIIANQKLFERRMARDLGVKAGGQIADIGCGRGRVANHIASITNASVTGINIDLTQLADARRFALTTGRQCEFKQADLNDYPLPFADQSLDGAYQVQALSLCKNLDLFFQDLFRALKPGAKFAFLDWIRLPAFDEKNPKHADLMRRIKPLIGAIGTPSADEFASKLQKAGFNVVVNENASIDALQAPLIENADKFFKGATKLIHFLVKVKVLPAHFRALFDRLTLDGEAFVEADRLRLVTTSHYIVAQKPS